TVAAACAVRALAAAAAAMAVSDPPRGGPPPAPHGGAFNPTPVPMAAGLAAMRLLTPDAYARLADLGAKLRASLDDCFKQSAVPGRVAGLGSLFRLHAVDRELSDYRSTRATQAEDGRLRRFVLPTR